MNVTTFLAPLDAARSGALRVVGRAGRAFLADRARRVALYGVLGVLSTLAITCAAPLWVFAFGPILLGVPHLVADVRYLVVRPGLAARRPLALAVGAPLAATLLFPTNVALGLAASFGAIALADASTRARALAGAVWLGVVAIAAAAPEASSLVVLHGHNVFAVVLFLVVFARRRALAMLPAGLFAALAAAMLLGVFDVFLLRASALTSSPRTGLALDGVVAAVAPLGDATMAVRLAVVFVFAQGVHYVMWLRLVPEEARERPGIRSFTSSFRALETDLGAPLLAGSVVAALALLFLASRGVDAARVSYLRAAAPHAYLEIAFAWLFLLERGRVRGREQRASS